MLPDNESYYLYSCKSAYNPNSKFSRERIGGFSTPVKPFDESLRHYNLLIFIPFIKVFINSSK